MFTGLRQIIGVEWRTHFIKLVRSVSREKEIFIEYVDGFSIANMNDEAIIQRLTTTIKSIPHLQDATVVLLMPRSNVIMRSMELPSVNKNELTNMIQLQLEKYIPYDSSTACYDFIFSPSQKHGYAQVLLAAMSKKDVQRISSVCTCSGLLPDIISVSSCSIALFCKKHVLSHEHTQRWSLIIDSDIDGTDFIVMKGDEFIYSRNFYHDQDFLLQEKREQFLEHVLAELERTLDIIRRDYSFDGLSNVVLGYSLSSFNNVFKERYKGDTNIILLKGYVDSVMRISTSAIAETISLSPLAGIEDIEEENILNLLSEDEKKESRKRGQARDKMTSFVLLGILALVLISYMFINFHSKFRQLQVVEQRLARINPEAKRMSTVIKSIELIDEVEKGQIYPLEFIAELYTIVPKTISLTFIDYDIKRGIELRGIAQSISQVSDLLLILQKSPYFKNAEIRFAKQKQLKGQELTDFEIVCPLMVLSE